MYSAQSTSSRKISTRQIAVIGLLSSVSIALGLSGYGFIPLFATRLTIMHIPVIIGAIVEGPIVGMSIGLIFGLFSLIQNAISPQLLSFAFLNPLVSVLPRLLIGVTSYYAYRIPFIKHAAIKTGVAAIIGTLTNSVGVLGMIYVLYAADYAAKVKIDPGAAAAAIFGIAATNGSLEAIVAVVITVPVVTAIRKIRKKSNV